MCPCFFSRGGGSGGGGRHKISIYFFPACPTFITMCFHCFFRACLLSRKGTEKKRVV